MIVNILRKGRKHILTGKLSLHKWRNQISLLKPSATLVINEESNRLQKEGKKVYKFGFGQSPFPIPENIVLELKKNANKNKYLPIQGLEELRTAISAYLNKYNKRILL